MHTEPKPRERGDTVSLAEAARLLGFSTRHTRRLVDAGALAVEERRGAATGTRYAIARTAVEQIAATRKAP